MNEYPATALFIAGAEPGARGAGATGAALRRAAGFRSGYQRGVRGDNGIFGNEADYPQGIQPGHWGNIA